MPLASRLSPVACAALAILLLSCSLGGETAPATKTITVGVDLPLTGDEGRAGTSTLNGVRYFVATHPSLDGYIIAIDARDDASPVARDTARGVQNLEAFIASGSVLAMIGPFDSNTARAQIPVANQAHLAMVSPATSSRCLTKEPFLPAGLNPLRVSISCAAAGLPSPADLRSTGVNNYFRLSTTDELQGPAAADFAYSHLHLQRVAVLSDGEAYGQALAEAFVSRFDKLRGTVVLQKDFNPTASPDLTPFLQAAKKDGAQGIYFGGAASNKGCAVRQQMATAFAAGEAAPLLGGDGIALDPTCVLDAGTNAAGMFATVPSLSVDSVAQAQPVIDSFKKHFGRTADYGAYTMAAYDAMGVVYSAIDRAIKAAGGNMPARDSIVAELSATSAYTGVAGTFGFDPSGDTTRRVVSIFESGVDQNAGWAWTTNIDYSSALPY